MENLDNQNVEQDSYKTGSTKPPKSRGGLVAGLLVAVILLAGVSSILGVMNIQLFRMLEEKTELPFSVAPTQQASVPFHAAQDVFGTPKLGVTVEGISELDRRYYHLPVGVLVTQLDPRGCAGKAGIADGDMILSVSGISVETAEALDQALQDFRAGESVEVEFYRYRTKQLQKVTVILEAEG
jgi:predicted metalloprotease with PDZ domain